ASAMALMTSGRSTVFRRCNSACKRSAPRAVKGIAAIVPDSKVKDAPCAGRLTTKEYGRNVVVPARWGLPGHACPDGSVGYGHGLGPSASRPGGLPARP